MGQSLLALGYRSPAEEERTWRNGCQNCYGGRQKLERTRSEQSLKSEDLFGSQLHIIKSEVNSVRLTVDWK